jgi:hypothetical protein
MTRKTAAEWEAELARLRAAQEIRPTFDRHMDIDHAIRMLAGARLREGENTRV